MNTIFGLILLALLIYPCLAWIGGLLESNGNLGTAWLRAWQATLKELNGIYQLIKALIAKLIWYIKKKIEERQLQKLEADPMFRAGDMKNTELPKNKK